VLVTRAEHQASDLVHALAARGAQALAVPTIEIAPPSDLPALDAQLRGVGAYDWVVFTSANGVRGLCGRAQTLGLLDAMRACRFACIGPATAQALEPYALAATLVPESFVGEAFAATLRQALQAAQPRVLLARAKVTRDVVPQGLRAAGCLVDEAVVYETRPAGAEHRERLVQELSSGRLDAVTFTSPSTVRGTLGLLGPGGPGLLRQTQLVTIGPVTSEALRQAKLPVGAEASPHTTGGMILALEALFAPRTGPEP
jgi:uroporphyrinogen III methyltransferase/synthase